MHEQQVNENERVINDRVLDFHGREHEERPQKDKGASRGQQRTDGSVHSIFNTQ